ncbi:hypothetical protein ACVDG3_18255 [Meridianimarinicoccus sp. RP-17]|uniref:hypothetical protein n=1 Tax=Meridianimarinicoccus zhengii TaxID=2056810 RepID=UPI0013A6A101|nr:hypothetical protein [Phycocomes zhengii]
MSLTDLARFAPFRNTADPGAGGGAGDPPADPGTGTPPPADPSVGDPPAAKWWEGEKLSDTQRQHLTAKGLTVEDPTEAIARLTDMHRHAEQRLGVSADQLMTRPKDGQDVSEWMRENAKVFGLPENADGYDTSEALKGLPKDISLDKDLEAQAKQIAFETGVPPAALNRFVGLYAEHVGKLVADADTQLAAANAEMMTALQNDWGRETPAKLAQARQAAQVIATKAGLDQNALQDLSGALSEKTGNANAIKMFAALGEMLGDDTMLGAGAGAQTMGTTPAEARAELASMRSPEGAYFKAVQSGNRAEIDRLNATIERLTKIAAGG